MTSIISITPNETEIRISINAPIGDVTDAVNDVVQEMGCTANGDAIAYLAERTKQWWYDFAKAVALRRIDQQAQDAANAAKENGLAELASSPLA